MSCCISFRLPALFMLLRLTPELLLRYCLSLPGVRALLSPRPCPCPCPCPCPYPYPYPCPLPPPLPSSTTARLSGGRSASGLSVLVRCSSPLLIFPLAPGVAAIAAEYDGARSPAAAAAAAAATADGPAGAVFAAATDGCPSLVLAAPQQPRPAARLHATVAASRVSRETTRAAVRPDATRRRPSAPESSAYMS